MLTLHGVSHVSFALRAELYNLPTCVCAYAASLKLSPVEAKKAEKA